MNIQLNEMDEIFIVGDNSGDCEYYFADREKARLFAYDYIITYLVSEKIEITDKLKNDVWCSLTDHSYYDDYDITLTIRWDTMSDNRMTIDYQPPCN